MSDFAVHVESLAAAHLRNPQFSVEHLAEMVGMTSRHLRRRLVAETGETPRALIRRLRVRQAEDILARGSCTISAVSRAVGYGDADSLRRAYHAVTGRRVPARGDRPTAPGLGPYARPPARDAGCVV